MSKTKKVRESTPHTHTHREREREREKEKKKKRKRNTPTTQEITLEFDESVDADLFRFVASLRSQNWCLVGLVGRIAVGRRRKEAEPTATRYQQQHAYQQSVSTKQQVGIKQLVGPLL